jgi:hypothetical protein
MLVWGGERLLPQGHGEAMLKRATVLDQKKRHQQPVACPRPEPDSE